MQTPPKTLDRFHLERWRSARPAMRRVSLTRDSDPNPSVCRILQPRQGCPDCAQVRRCDLCACVRVWARSYRRVGQAGAQEGVGGWSVFVEQDCPAPGLPGSVAGGWRVNRLGGDQVGAGQDCDPMGLGLGVEINIV